jgi:IS30 family transposase
MALVHFMTELCVGLPFFDLAAGGFRHLFETITVDNGSEFHGCAEIERATGTTFYFATPYHSWERGTNENTNRLSRQYIPKRSSMNTSPRRGVPRSPSS